MTPGRPVVRRTTVRRLTAALGALLGAALTAGVLPAVPAQAAFTLHADQVAAAGQCSVGLGNAERGGGTRKARALMAGRADLDEYGWFHLAANPSWKPVSTLDSSGKGHMHSLNYLLPLLRRGVAGGHKDMLDRFYFLLRDWVRDNKPGGPTSRYAWGPPIYEGFRAQVLVCAAAGPRGQQPWLLNALKKHGEMMADPRRYEGINNASLHQSMGLYAIGATLGRPAWRRLAIARERALAVRLIHDDGSDEEGALTYAVNDYRWFRHAAERLRVATDQVPPELLRTERMPGFIAAATRPDGRLEALGDTSPYALNPNHWIGTAAEFAATRGASGTPPADTFASFAGGYVFGRSGWGSEKRPLTDETYYSVRAGQGEHVPHAHDDSGSLTLYSHGSPLLLDTGQWRYTYGTTRSFVVSRAAHNVVVVDGVRRTRPRPELRTARVDGLDLTTVVDRGYDGVTLTRTVAYDRVEDVVLVWDRLSSAKSVRASQQWGVGRDRSVRLDADAVHTSGPGANVSMLFTSGGAPLDVARGRKKPMRGWNSQAYGELSSAPSVRASQRGTSLSWLTVIAPRADGVAASSVSATAAVSVSNASVLLSTADGSATVNLDAVSGSRTPPTTVTPSAVPTADIVLAGTSTTVRGTGLVPSAPVTLEALPVGALAWTPVATGTASAAGTAELPAQVPTTTDFRVVSASGPSGPVRVTAAVAPAAPTNVIATPTGNGKVTVTWDAPADTGGAPLTQFGVRVDGKRVAVPAGARSAVVSGVRAGSRIAKVRAFNSVAVSTWTEAPAAVPAYPSVTGTSRVRRGGMATLHLAGLLPNQPVTVRVTVLKSGKVTTRTVGAKADGTATVRLRVWKPVRVVAVSGGVTSARWRIGVP